MPETWMSTIFTELDKTNGVAAAVAGFVIGETTAVALPLAAENVSVIAGNCSVDRRLAEVTPAGIVATLLFGVDPSVTDTEFDVSPGETDATENAVAAVGVKWTGKAPNCPFEFQPQHSAPPETTAQTEEPIAETAVAPVLPERTRTGTALLVMKPSGPKPRLPNCPPQLSPQHLT
jgi:hypothetical protein